MRINSLIRFSNGEYEVAAPVHSPHIKGRRYSALEAKIPAEFDIYRTFPAKPPKKGLGWFFSLHWAVVGSEMGNGTSEFLPRSRRLLGAKTPPFCWLSSIPTFLGSRQPWWECQYMSSGHHYYRRDHSRAGGGGGWLEWMIGRCLDFDRGGGQSPDPHLSRQQPSVENGI